MHTALENDLINLTRRVQADAKAVSGFGGEYRFNLDGHRLHVLAKAKLTTGHSPELRPFVYLVIAVDGVAVLQSSARRADTLKALEGLFDTLSNLELEAFEADESATGVWRRILRRGDHWLDGDQNSDASESCS